MSSKIEYKETKENALDLLNEMEGESKAKTEIDIDKIILGSNIREDYNPESLKELQDSIKAYGQLQPVGINKNNELVYGFRRYKAIKGLGRKTIKVVFIDPSLSTSKVTIQIIENLQREDLNEYEYSKAIQELVKELKDKFPYPLASKALKKKPTWIQDRLNYKNGIENLEKHPSLSTSKVKENLSVNELKEINSLKEEKKIPIIQGIIKSKSEGKAKTIKEIRKEASSHKANTNKPVKVTKAKPSKKELQAELTRVRKEIARLLTEKKKLENQIGKMK